MSARGFTLLEVVLVMLVAGILALMVVPRLIDLSTLEDRPGRSEALAALRYARALAMGSGCQTRLVVKGGYRVERRRNCITGSFSPVSHPAYLTCDPDNCSACSSDSDYAGCPADLSASREVFRFDSLGRVLGDNDTPLNGEIYVGSETFVVVGETGFAHVSNAP